MARPRIPAAAARQLLLDGQQLLADPAQRATPRLLKKTVDAMGYVQVDTINRIERAHHHILHTRLDGYRPEQLGRLLERDRAGFEHWTHDASVIRADWFPYWKHRFDAYRQSKRLERWIRSRIGEDPERVTRGVLRRITKEGPLTSRDFEDPKTGESGGWWQWKPSRAALEMLWRIGKISISGRRGFLKVYDRTDRVFPELSKARRPGRAQHVDWACRAAMERLAIATPTEIAYFLQAVDRHATSDWAKRAVRGGELVEVDVGSADGGADRTAFAWDDWRERVARLPPAPDRIRLINPFDPAIHDRARTQRRFGFDYTIECFVPEKKRKYGYYVLPILERDRFVGRLDPKLNRDRGVLEIAKIWWEPGVHPTRKRVRDLESALDLLATQVGAQGFEISPG